MILFFFIGAIASSVKDAHDSIPPSLKTALIQIAMSTHPLAISLKATIADYDVTMLREDIYQWVLNTEGNPPRINLARLDKVWLSWSDRLIAGKKSDNENQLFELASILQGDALVDNDVSSSYGMHDHEKGLKTGHLHDLALT